MGEAADARQAKADLRSAVLGRRAALPAHVRAQASSAIVERLRSLSELQGARAVLGYARFGAEVDLDPLLAVLLERELGVFLPYVDGAQLGIARVSDLEADLVPGWRGVREPRALGRRSARPERLDAAIVPGVAFDRRGGRLGYGGGHFDRLLARLRPDVPVVAVAYACQLVQAVPLEAHDRRVDVVVTEQEVVRPTAYPTS